MTPELTESSWDSQLTTTQELDLESMRFSMCNAGVNRTVVDVAVSKVRQIANYQKLDDHHVRITVLIMMQIIGRSPLHNLISKIESIPLDIGIAIPDTMDPHNLPPVPMISNRRTIMTEGDRERMAAAEAKRARKAAKLRRELT